MSPVVDLYLFLNIQDVALDRTIVWKEKKLALL